MYFVFEEKINSLAGKYRKNIKNEQQNIAKEREQSKNDLSQMCDCDTYCEKYKIKEPLIEPTIKTPKKNISLNIFDYLKGVFNNKSEKVEEPNTIREPENNETFVDFEKNEQPDNNKLQIKNRLLF
jgi:hypothetical protein